jgi:LPS-assembly lipoprotein
MLLFRCQFSSDLKPFFTALVLVMFSLLGACGYVPLYDQRASTGHNVKKQLELIQIQPIQDRIGHLLHNNLLVRINPTGEPANPLYTLHVIIEETSTSLGIKKSAVVTRGNLEISATFTLSKITSLNTVIKADMLTTATVTSISSYDIPQAQYTALTALKDAQTRAIREIADNIRTRLGIYFHQSLK